MKRRSVPDWWMIALMVALIFIAGLVLFDRPPSPDPSAETTYESPWFPLGDGWAVKMRVELPEAPPEPTATPVPTHTPTVTPIPTATPADNVYVIPDNVDKVNGDDMGLQPGDVLLIPSTRTQPLTFVGVQGTPDQPIIITNSGGQVNLAGDHWVGIQFQGCEYFRLTGTGEAGVEYGFALRDFTNAGIYARLGSRNFEIDHVEVAGTMAGIRVQTYGDEVPEGWVLTGVYIHDNYIHDTLGEAFYVGHRVDTGKVLLDGLEMAYNRAERVGTDGLQIRQAHNCNVHDNYIHTTGVRLIEIEEERPNQGGAGLIIGPDCTGEWHSNTIINANRGVQIQSEEDDVQIYNNLIIDAGQIHGDLRNEGGIRWFGDGGASIYNNTIVGSYAYGIRASSSVVRGAIWNNIVAGPDRLYHIKAGIATYNNIEADMVDEVGLVDPANGDYHLAAGSIAIDAGGEPCPIFDLDDQERVGACDIGAFEYRE